MENTILSLRKERSIKNCFKAFIMLLACFISLQSQAQNCTVNAGVGFTVYANETIALDGNQNGLVDVNAVWSQVSGPSIIIDDPSNLNSTLSGLGSVGGNDITLRLTATCDDGALITQDVTFTVESITIADAGDDITATCPSTSVLTLAGNTPGAGESGEWTSSGAGVTIDNPANPTSTVTLADNASGTATLTWTIKNSDGGESSDDMTITNLGGESPVSAGPDQNLDNCYSSVQSTTLNASYGGDGTNGQIGTWTIVSGPNLPVLSDASNNGATLSNLIEGTYELNWTVEGACISGTDDMTITVTASDQDITEADAGDFTVYCDGRESSVLIGNTPQYEDETVLWEFVSGPGTPTIDEPTSVITQISGLSGSGSGTFTFRYTISNTTFACSSAALVSFEYISLPTLTVNSGGDYIDITCGDTEYDLDYITVGGDNFDVSWEIISGPTLTGLTVDNSSPITIEDLDQPGVYTVRVSAASNSSFGASCPAVYDDVNLVVSENPTAANPGTAQVLACGVDFTALQGNTPMVGTGTWYQVSGPNTATIVNPLDPETSVSNLLAGNYQFKWVITGGANCDANEGTVNITVSTDPPTTPLAGSDVTVCAGTGYELQGNDLASTESGLWTVTPSTGITFIDDADNNTIVYGFSASQVYTLTWTVNGCASTLTDEIVITTNALAGPAQAVAGPDQDCLATASTTLAGNDPGTDTGTWTVVSGSGNFVDDNLFNTVVNTLGTGTNVFRWTISNASGCDPTTDDVSIFVSGTSTAASITAVGDQCVVSGGTVDLFGSAVTSGETVQWTQLEGPATVITGETGANATAAFTVGGTYSFQYEVDNGCATSTDEVSFQIGIESTTAAAGSDQSICSPGSSLFLSGNTISDGYGLWTFVSGPNLPSIFDVFDPTTSVSGLTKGSYVFRWSSYSNSSLCSVSSDEVTIDVDVQADAGDDQQLCNAESTILVGNENTSGTWSEVTSNGASISIVSGSPHMVIVSGLTINTDYTFRYSLTSAGLCGNTTDDVVVEVDGFGTAPDAGPDQELCGATTFTMAANTVSSGTGTWVLLTSQSGVTFSPNANSPTATVNGVSDPGLYLFSWQVVNGACSYEDEMIIQNYANEVAVTSADQAGVCSDDVVISANATQYGSGSWTEDAGNPELDALSSYVEPDPDFLATTAGTYIFTWNIDNGDFCTDSSDPITITVVSTSPSDAEVGEDQEICLGDADPTITGNVPTSGTGVWSLESSAGGSPTFTASSATTTVGDLTVAGDYVFRWTVTSGSCDSFDELTITVLAAPVATSAGTDAVFCGFSQPTLNASIPAIGTGTWTQSSGPTTANITDSDSETSDISNLIPGDYVFDWTISNGGCATTTDDVTITIVDQVSQANAGSDQSDVGLSTTLGANAADTDETGTWTIISKPAGAADPTFGDENSESSTVNGLVPGDYTFRWTIDDDNTPTYCPTFDEVTITAIPVITITASPATQSEDGTGTIIYTFTANATLTSDLTIDFLVGGTATLTDDYLVSGADAFGASSGSVTITSGNSTAQVTVSPESDDNIEIDETVILTVDEGTNYIVGSPSVATGTIQDDDDTGIEIELIFNRDGAEGGNSARFRVVLTDGAGTQLTNETGDNFTANFNVVGDIDDFSAGSFTSSRNITNGNSFANIAYGIFDDLLIEGDETNAATATLTGASHNGSLTVTPSGTTNSASVDIIDNDDNVIIEVITKQDGKEGETDAGYTVRLVNAAGDVLTNATGSDFTADVAFTGATQADFSTTFPTSIAVGDGDSSTDIDLTPVSDLVVEIETLTATLSNPAHGGTITTSVSGTNDSADADIDDDAEFEITTTQDGAEGGNNVQYTVELVDVSSGASLTNGTGANLTATIAFNGGDAVQADLSTTFPTGITISNGVGSVLVDLAVEDDVLIEGTETLTATLSNPITGVTVSGTNGSDDADILDNDTSLIVMELTATDGGEGTTDVLFTAQLTNGSGLNLINDTGSDITADITFSTSSAVDADFTSVLGTLETAGIDIPDGDGSQIVTLVINDDFLIEGDETIEATLSNPVGATITGATDSDIATVADNDDDDVRMVIEKIEDGVEGGQDIEFEIRLEDASGNELTNALGSAFTGSIVFSGATLDDFTETSFPTTFSIADGASSTTITFDPVNDASFEAESLTATISSPNTVASITPTISTNAATASIDDDAIWEIATTQNGEEGGNDVIYTVSLVNGAGTPLTNNSGSAISTNVSFVTGSDALQTDLNTTFPTSVSIANSSSSQTITLVVADDDLLEGEEDLVATLSSPGVGSISGTDGSATATIDDADDNDPQWVIAATQDGEEGGADVEYTVTLEDGSGNTLTNVTGAGVTADIDFTGLSEAVQADLTTTFPTTVTVANNTDNTVITLVVANDDLLEGDEDLRATLSNESIGSILTASADATIDDADDNDPQWVITATQDGEEGGNDVEYTVTLEDGSGNTLTNVTGAGVTANVNFTGLTEAVQADLTTIFPTSVAVANNTNNTVITLAVADDDLLEGDEDLRATISSPSIGSIDTATADATIDDADDDDAIWIITATQDGEEGGNAVIFTVELQDGSGNTLTNTTGAAVTADINFTGLSEAVQADFSTTFPTGVSIANGSSSVTVTLNVAADDLLEGDEDLRATISSPSIGSIDTATADATIEDVDDDDPQWVIAATQDGVEGGADVEYTVTLEDGSGNTLTNVTGAGVTANVNFTGLTEAVQADLTTTFPTTVTVANNTDNTVITLAVADDDLLEGDEDLRATISSPSIGSIDTATADATIDDTDDNDPQWIITATQDGEEGGNDVEYTVTLEDGSGNTLTNVTGAGVTANVNFTGLTEAVQADLTTTFPITVTVANNTNNTVITLVVADDDLLEGDEDLRATISSPSIGSIDTATADATIDDADDDGAVWEIATTTNGVEGGSNVVFTATLTDGAGNTLTNVSGSGVTADISFATGSEAVQADLTTTFPTTITVDNNESTEVITLVVADDDLLEGEEDLVATLTGTTTGSISGTDGSTTATIDDADDNDPQWIITATQDGEEGGDDVEYTVTLEDGSGNTLTNVTGAGVTANVNFTGLTDAVQADLTTTFPTTVTVANNTDNTVITLVVADDDLLEGDEDLRATISSPSIGSIDTATADATIDDADDNDPQWIITATQDGEEGGDDVEYTVTLEDGSGNTLTNVTGAGVTANVNFTGLTEAVQADLTTPFPTTVTVANNTDNTVITLVVADDDLLEGDEDLRATISSPSIGSIDTATADATIDDADDNDPQWVITATQDGEEGGNAVIFTIELQDGAGNALTNTTGAAVTADINFTGLSEAVQADFSTVFPTGISIADGSSSVAVTLNVADDNLLEGDEDLRATISSPSIGSIDTATADATVDDADDDDPQWVITATQDGEEGGADVEYTVTLEDGAGNTLTNVTGAGVTANVNFTGLTEAVQADLTTTFPTTVTVANNTDNTVITLAVADDDLLEGDEDLRATISSPSIGSIDTATADATIDDADDDGAVWEIATTTNGVEGGSNVVFTATLTDGSGNTLTNVTGGGVTANISFATGSEAVQDDLTTTFPTTITVDNNESTEVITLLVADDDLLEGEEDLVATLTGTTTGTISGTDGSATATIDDADDNDPQWIITATQDGVEGGADVEYTVTLEDGSGNTLTNVTGAGVTANVNFTGLTEAIQADLTTTFPSTVTVANNTTNTVITLAVADDNLLEGDEDLRATISSPSIGSIDTATADATIDDADDDDPQWVITATQDGEEGGNDVEYTVTLEDGSGNTLTNVTGAGVTANVNFTGLTEAVQADLTTTFPTTVTVANNTNNTVITLAVADDDLLEGDEDLRATISSPSIGSIDTATADATIDDADDDGAVWEIATTTNGVEGGVNVVFTATLTDGAGNTLTNVSGSGITADISFATGSEAVQDDLTTTFPTTITVDNNESTEVITLVVADDDLLEGEEDLVATLTGTTTGTISGTDGSTTATIDDADDNDPQWIITATQDGEEGGDDVEYTVTLEDGSGNTLTNVTGAGVTANVNFTGLTEAVQADLTTTFPTTVTVANNTDNTVITLVVADDDLLEGDEDLRATISSPSIGSIDTATADATIDDADDNDPQWIITATQDGEEGGNAVIFTVELQDGAGNALTNTTGAAVTADINFTGLSEAVQADFSTTFPTGISIANGSSSVAVTLNVADDNLLEGDEDLRATISSPSIGSIDTATADATIDDADDDDPQWVITATQDGEEGGDDVEYTVTLEDGSGNTLTNVTGAGVTANVNFTGLTEAVQADLTTTFPTTVTVANNTDNTVITLAVADDDLLEGDEDLRATISSPSIGNIDTATADATIDDADDDGAVWEITTTTNGVEGGLDVVFTATLTDGAGNTLTNVSGSGVTADISFATGSEAVQVDLTTTFPTTITVDNNESTEVITLVVADDDLLEGEEDLVATLTGTTTGTISGTDGSTTATIDDADDDDPQWIITATQDGVEGGADVEYTVTLEDGSGNTLTNVTGAGVTADIDFTGLTEAVQADLATTFPSTVTVANNTDNTVITLVVANDDLLEGDEDLRATISSPSIGSIDTATADATIDDADDNNPQWVITATQDGEEGGDDVEYTVTLEDGSGNTLTNLTGAGVTANVNFTGLTEAVQADLATIFPTTVTVANNTDNTVITLVVADDNLLEDDELLRATIDSPSIGSVLTASADATIVDAEFIGAIWEIEALQDGSEDGTDVQYVVRLVDASGNTITNVSGVAITVDVAYVTDSDAEQVDLTTTLPSQISIGVGQSSTTLDLVVNDDDLIEGDEVLTATLANPSTGAVSLTAGSDVATIVDNDFAPDVIIESANESTNEDENLVFNATNGNEITIEDADGDIQEVTIIVTNGILDLTDIAGLVVTGDSTGTITITGGSLADINDALADAVFTPAEDFNGDATIEITTEDPKGGTDTEIITIEVLPVNDPPVATDEMLTTPEDTPVSGDLSDNVTDIDGDDLTFSVVPGTEPDSTEGTLVLNPDGSYTFTPADDFVGTVDFTYEVCDDGVPVLCAQADVTIEVTPVNDPPVAEDESQTIEEDTEATGDLTDNVSDIDSDNLTITIVTEPSEDQGVLVLNDDGTYVFTPTEDYFGEVVFTYEVCDDGTPVECSQADVTITITDVIDDTDGDGVLDNDETDDGTDPLDPCSFDLESVTVTPTTAWDDADCDGDGVTNGGEILDDTDPSDYCDFIPVNVTLEQSQEFLDADCDDDGLSNEDEIGDDNNNPVDTDDDGTPDFLDDDDDNDGIGTNIEFSDNQDCDEDGIPDYLDPDRFNCGEDIPATLFLSPFNDDNINDYFAILVTTDDGYDGLSEFESAKVVIFNRWGNIVWETDTYDNNDPNHRFEGYNFRGNELPQGTYYFVLDLKRNDGGKERVEKGFIEMR